MPAVQAGGHVRIVLEGIGRTEHIHIQGLPQGLARVSHLKRWREGDV